MEDFVPILPLLLLKNSLCFYPRANGAKRRSGRKPGARVTNSACYLRLGKCEHSEVQSHPPCHGRTTNDGFCRYAHARVITDFKNMADYHEERTLKASGKGENQGRRKDERARGAVV